MISLIIKFNIINFGIFENNWKKISDNLIWLEVIGISIWYFIMFLGIFKYIKNEEIIREQKLKPGEIKVVKEEFLIKRGDDISLTRKGWFLLVFSLLLLALVTYIYKNYL